MATAIQVHVIELECDALAAYKDVLEYFENQHRAFGTLENDMYTQKVERAKRKHQALATFPSDCTSPTMAVLLDGLQKTISCEPIAQCQSTAGVPRPGNTSTPGNMGHRQYWNRQRTNQRK
jgi:hypothetical protein